jgi:hypothetical protein
MDRYIRLVIVLAAGLSSWGAAVSASPDEPRSLFSPLALRRAVLAAEDGPPPAQDPAWSGVERLPGGVSLSIAVDGQPAVHGPLVSADSGGLSIRLGDGRVERVVRANVVEVRQLTRARGSKRNAIIGAAAGGFLGYLMAVNLALRDCGGDCSDERFLVGASLAGTPVAGGLLGYYAFGGRETSRVIYRRP